MPTAVIDLFRKRVNEYYQSLKLRPQQELLLPKEDVAIENLQQINKAFVDELAQLEPFGNGNLEPVLKIAHVQARSVRRMGADGQHVKIEIQDVNGKTMQMLAFNADTKWFVEVGDVITVWFQPTLNEWNGVVSVEGRICNLETVA